jgi:hypothetical protein
MTILLLFAALSTLGIAGTIRAVHRDGYRAAPTRSERVP